jgi:hypothetical protein
LRLIGQAEGCLDYLPDDRDIGWLFGRISMARTLPSSAATGQVWSGGFGHPCGRQRPEMTGRGGRRVGEVKRRRREARRGSPREGLALHGVVDPAPERERIGYR